MSTEFILQMLTSPAKEDTYTLESMIESEDSRFEVYWIAAALYQTRCDYFISFEDHVTCDNVLELSKVLQLERYID